MVVGSKSHGHHPVVGVVQESEICKKHEPHELGNRPLESHHSIDYNSIYHRLYQDVRNLYSHLQPNFHAMMYCLLDIIL